MCRRNELVALDLIITAVSMMFAFVAMIGTPVSLRILLTLFMLLHLGCYDDTVFVCMWHCTMP